MQLRAWEGAHTPNAEWVSMRSLKPWLRITNLRQELDRLFDRVFESRPDEFPATGDWVPSLDLSETTDALVLKMEVPGMDAKDVQVSLQENPLTVKGERKQEKEETGEQYHQVERRHGAFTRSMRLPVGVDGSKVNATFKNGLLVVTMPKTPAAKGFTIPVKPE
jgi:HSP20 family protein